MSNAPRPTIAAFLSASGGAGRTSTVANLAWVLSSAGKRVLVVDWGSEPPRVPEYLEPFHADQVQMSDATGRLLAALYDATGLNTPFQLGRYTVPTAAVPAGTGYVDVFAPVVPDGSGPARGDQTPSDGDATALRDRLHAEPYDVVLIDAPTSETEDALSLLSSIADVVAVCFKPRPGSVEHAGRLAKRLRQRVLPPDVVPVATMVRHQRLPRADRSRAQIRAAFTVALGDQVPRMPGDPVVEIPYQAHEAFDPLLAVLVEDDAVAHDEPDLLAQYGRLADAITAGAVTEVPRVAREFQQRYRRIFGLATTTEPDRVLIVYAPRDRAWADWVRSALGRAGVTTAFLREEPGWLGVEAVDVLVVSSAAGAATTNGAAPAWPPRDLPGRAVWMLTEKDAIAPGDSSRFSVAGLDEDEARRLLLRHLDLIDRPDEPGADPMRFPTRIPTVRRRPRRHPRFVGRDADLEEIRDQVLASRVTTLSGPAGIGKSELALEYVYRFTGDYDLIWWIPAHDRPSALVSIAQLAQRMRGAESPDLGSVEYGTTTPLAELATGLRYKSWLLVYDNVDDLDEISDLLPDGGPGHVLITSADSPAADMTLAELPIGDSVRLLLERVPDVDAEAAREVAAVVGNLPLALQLAGSWLIEAIAVERRTGTPSGREAAAWAVRRFLERMSEDDESGADIVAHVVRVLVEALRGSATGRNALLLAQLCSFLSTQGIDLRLVRSSTMINALVRAGGADAEPLALDSWEVDRALWIGVRFGVFRVDWGADSSLRIHRVVQKVLQDSMSDEERAVRRAHVLSALAEYAPIEVEERSLPTRAAKFAELQKHVFVSGALTSGDPLVRRWLVNQLRFLFTDGGVGISYASTEPAHALLADWTRRFGQDDPLRNRLATQLANVERHLGNSEAALALDDGALVHQRRSLELTHPQTLITARGRGGDLRGLGYFAEALDEDTATWEGYREIFGDDHPDTRRAANNLAHSRYLAGDAAAALTLELDNFRRLRRLLGPDDGLTRWSQTKIGIFQRELGRFDEALATLRTAWQKLQNINDRNERGPDEAELATLWQLAVTQRLSGNPKGAQARSSRALGGFREVVGPYHPTTIACRLSLANDHRMLDDASAAIGLAREVISAYRTELGYAEEHPFLAAARLCLGSALCAHGEPEDGENEVLAALEGLRYGLGDDHPWTVAAVVSQARARAVLGHPAEARDLLTAARDDCLNYFGPDHPVTIITTENLGVAASPDLLADAGWRDIHVDIPQT
ncbi:FxSxx-COOH system tetratricopeptide repeat protein [Lentzea sp. CA-135723]|uniref:FxSxx-COOH system tetratricopeptide repeat protein n=1 Tax=Lentzea sp. CA-135723 TaxID=3239950 RepID=UPI003D8D05D7